MKDVITNQMGITLENKKLYSSPSLDTKEKLVSEFVKTISDIEFKPCDEIENNHAIGLSLKKGNPAKLITA